MSNKILEIVFSCAWSYLLGSVRNIDQIYLSIVEVNPPIRSQWDEDGDQRSLQGVSLYHNYKDRHK